MALFRSVATIGSLTLISRLLGFVRDSLFAAVLGAGPVSDAFIVAFKLPNIFRRLFAEGAFNAAFVPLYALQLHHGGETAARAFAERALAVLLVALLVFCGLAMAFMPILMHGLAPGFADEPEKFTLAVELTRLTFPYILFISIVSLQGAVLNAHNRFGPPAATPIVLNLVLIASLVGPARAFEPAHSQAWAVTIAGIAQFVWLAISLKRAGLELALPRPKLSSEIRQLFRLITPAVIGSGAMQLNVLVDTMLGTLLPTGSVSYLFYADRLNQLPLGVIGIAIGTALLPLMTRQLAAGNQADAMTSQNRALEFAFFLTLPSATAFIAVPGAIVSVLFERGAFTAEDTRATAMALAAFAAGLPAYVAIKVLTPGFHARRDTATPVRIAILSMVVNFVLNLALMIPLKHVGLALATAIAAWLNAGQLAWVLHRRGHFKADAQLVSRTARTLAACLLMGAAVAFLWDAMVPHLGSRLLTRVAGLFGLSVSGIVLFGAAGWILGAFRWRELKAMFRRAPRT
jgi:putative peptidoglycan lipid II flippase